LDEATSGSPDSADKAAAIEIRDLSFSYVPGKLVLEIPELRITRGERVFLFGPSGSGKTTLLGLITGVLQAQTGSITVLGHDFAHMSGSQRDEFRAVHIGYIFQMFNLIPYLSVLENILLPCRLSAARRDRLGGVSLEKSGEEVARQLGIGDLINEQVTELSVGQQQRVAAARALVGHPELVVADEPTSALDTDLREAFLELLFRSCELAGATLVFVSHDRQLQPLFTSSLSLPEVNRASLSFAGKKVLTPPGSNKRVTTPPGSRKWG
jgi:putative ABC transport system ATP-binding protein